MAEFFIKDLDKEFYSDWQDINNINNSTDRQLKIDILYLLAVLNDYFTVQVIANLLKKSESEIEKALLDLNIFLSWRVNCGHNLRFDEFRRFLLQEKILKESGVLIGF